MNVNHERMLERRDVLVHRLAAEQDHIRSLLMSLYRMDEATAVLIACQHKLGGPVLAQLMRRAQGR